jgi:hypothetical protein
VRPGPWAGLIDAAAETDAARRTELVTGTWRDAYAGRLTASDVELGCQVIAGHVHQVLAIVTAAATGAPPPQAGLSWMDRLAEISAPVTVVSARRASRIARAIADMAPDGRFIAAAADRPGMARGPHPGKGCDHGHARPAALTDSVIPRGDVLATPSTVLSFSGMRGRWHTRAGELG